MYLDEVYLYKEWPFAQHHQVILDLFLMIPRLPNVHLSGMKFVGSLYALVYAEYFFGKKNVFVECRNLLEDVCAVYELLSWILFIKNTSISIVIYNISYIIYI